MEKRTASTLWSDLNRGYELKLSRKASGTPAGGQKAIESTNAPDLDSFRNAKGEIVSPYTGRIIGNNEPKLLDIVNRNRKKQPTILELDQGRYSPKGRKLKKAFERPNPDLPPSAQDNRSRKVVSITLPHALLKALDERCQLLDVDRSAYVQAAIERTLKPE